MNKKGGKVTLSVKSSELYAFKRGTKSSQVGGPIRRLFLRSTKKPVLNESPRFVDGLGMAHGHDIAWQMVGYTCDRCDVQMVMASPGTSKCLVIHATDMMLRWDTPRPI